MTGAQFDERGGEVDIDLLADYIGGCLTGTPDESVVAARIADDPAWRDAYEDLSDGMAAVGAELAGFGSEPMPAELAARLDALLTSPVPAEITESAPIRADLAAPPAPHLMLVRDPDAVDDGADVVRNGETPQRKRGNKAGSARRLRWATPIAIAAGFVAFVGFSLDYLAGTSGEKSATSTAGGAGLAQRNAHDDAGTLSAADFRELATGTNYTSATLAEAPEASGLALPDSPLFTKSEPSGSAAGSAPASVAESDPLLDRLRVRSVLQICLDAIQAANAAGTIAVESVDFAKFDGKPAIIVRFGGPNGARVWASGPECGMPGRGADTLASVPVR